MDPSNLKKLLITIAVLYLVFPRDLIPDLFGRGFGFIDDLLFIALLYHFYRKHLKKHSARANQESGKRDQQERSGPTREEASERAFDPHEILGITSSASRETIRAAYKARMKEYHPDKVAHLGEELQALAHQKALEIQRAYQQLCK